MASKSDPLVPVLLLAGLAAFLLYRRGQPITVPQASAIRASATDKVNAIGSAIGGFFSYLGGATSNDGNHSSARPSDAALDQVIEAARVWQSAYGGAAGVDGDPYWSD